MKRLASKRAVSAQRKAPVSCWPSHTRFVELIGYCTRGTSHPVLRCGHAGDHIAEMIDLYLDDIDPFLWDSKAGKEGPTVRKVFQELEERICRDNDLRAAEIVYAIATHAAHEVIDLYLRHRELFDRITPRRNFLPALFSIHPKTAKVAARMLADSRLGTETKYARQGGSRAYFVSDSPANVYARAIIKCVELNRELEPISRQQYGWRKFDRKEGIKTVVLPFPRFVEGLDKLPIPITPRSVLAYWRKGKEIILEEMPNFHERPEWSDYHNRHYSHGAKTGAIQHAVFKDILAALLTIAGANKRKTRASKRKVKS